MSEPPPPIERLGDGGFAVRLGEGERDLLRRLTIELEAVLADEPGDPALRRLRPPAYEDEAAAQEFLDLMGSELEARRLENLRRLEATADSERLSAEELDGWLTALNDLRLVLGTRLGVTEDQFADGFDPSSPDAYELAVYAFLTWLQEAAVEAASAAFGPEP